MRYNVVTTRSTKFGSLIDADVSYLLVNSPRNGKCEFQDDIKKWETTFGFFELGAVLASCFVVDFIIDFVSNKLLFLSDLQSENKENHSSYEMAIVLADLCVCKISNYG